MFTILNKVLRGGLVGQVIFQQKNEVRERAVHAGEI